MRQARVMAVLVAVLGPATPLLAQSATEDDAARPHAPSSEVASETGAFDSSLAGLLDVDAASLDTTAPVRRRSIWHDPLTPEWTRVEKPDGSTAVGVKRPLPLAWDAKIGADLAPAAPLPTYGQPLRPLPQVDDHSSGAAWANIAVPNVAAIDLRVGTEQDRSSIGASLSRSLPLGDAYSLSFENRYVVTEIPNSATPPTASGSTAPAWAWSTDRLLKFNILATGTSFGAGTVSSTADNVTHNKLIAEQKIYGPLNITTAVTDPGAPTSAKSISAGFRLKW